MNFKKLLLFLFNLYLGFTLFGGPEDDFLRIVDFSTKLQDLKSLKPEQVKLLQKKLLLLNGTISEVFIVNDNPDQYEVKIEIIQGQWQGTETVVIYRAYIILKGPQYYAMFPPAVRGAPKATVESHAELLVVARLIGTEQTEKEAIAVLEGIMLRTLY